MAVGATLLALVVPGCGMLMANIPADDRFPVMCVDVFGVHSLPIRSNRSAVKVKFPPRRKRNGLRNAGRNGVIGCAVVACDVNLDVRAIAHFEGVSDIAVVRNRSAANHGQDERQ